jgi:hypothetical protein
MEANVTVNGKRLTIGEVMTLRVALTTFASNMQKPDSLGDDEHGKAMREGYLHWANATLDKMING